MTCHHYLGAWTTFRCHNSFWVTLRPRHTALMISQPWYAVRLDVVRRTTVHAHRQGDMPPDAPSSALRALPDATNRILAPTCSCADNPDLHMLSAVADYSRVFVVTVVAATEMTTTYKVSCSLDGR